MKPILPVALGGRWCRFVVDNVVLKRLVVGHVVRSSVERERSKSLAGAAQDRANVARCNAFRLTVGLAAGGFETALKVAVTPFALNAVTDVLLSELNFTYSR